MNLRDKRKRQRNNMFTPRVSKTKANKKAASATRAEYLIEFPFPQIVGDVKDGGVKGGDTTERFQSVSHEIVTGVRRERETNGLKRETSLFSQHRRLFPHRSLLHMITFSVPSLSSCETIGMPDCICCSISLSQPCISHRGEMPAGCFC